MDGMRLNEIPKDSADPRSRVVKPYGAKNGLAADLAVGRSQDFNSSQMKKKQRHTDPY